MRAECGRYTFTDRSGDRRNGKGDKRRVTYIGQRVRQELRRYLKTRRDLTPDAPLFATDEGSRFSYNGLCSLMVRHGRDAGLDLCLRVSGGKLQAIFKNQVISEESCYTI